MPTLNGIEATRQIVEQVPGTTVFLCSTYQRDDLPPEAETSGFAAYVNKEELGPDLLRQLWDEQRPPARAYSARRPSAELWAAAWRAGIDRGDERDDHGADHRQHQELPPEVGVGEHERARRRRPPHRRADRHADRHAHHHADGDDGEGHDHAPRRPSVAA